MKKYKPEYLGKVIPADDPTKMTDFVQNKYNGFSKIYDSCKEESQGISDIRLTSNSSEDKSSISIQISTDEQTLNKISEKINEEGMVKISGDVITAGG
jgi:hypothetical protein